SISFFKFNLKSTPFQSLATEKVAYPIPVLSPKNRQRNGRVRRRTLIGQGFHPLTPKIRLLKTSCFQKKLS
ncbi:MAG: hypothetical protein LBM93_09445, partial [Oscillospiraceae bacterium]|nr:hypothetical protein [Oscillospiraceae bacterium]